MPLSGGFYIDNSLFGPNLLEPTVQTFDWGLPYVEETGFLGVNHLGGFGGFSVFDGWGAPALPFWNWDLGVRFFGDVGGYVGDWEGLGGDVWAAGQILRGWGDQYAFDPASWGPDYLSGGPTVFDSLYGKSSGADKAKEEEEEEVEEKDWETIPEEATEGGKEGENKNTLKGKPPKGKSGFAINPNKPKP